MKIRVIIWDAAQEARRYHRLDDTATPVLADYVMELDDLAQRVVLARQLNNALKGGQSVTTIPTGE